MDASGGALGGRAVGFNVVVSRVDMLAGCATCVGRVVDERRILGDFLYCESEAISDSID